MATSQSSLTMSDGLQPIPSPPGLPFVGNAGEFDSELPIRTFTNWADKYGEIYRVYLPGGRNIVFVNTQALVHELCNEKRFQKSIEGSALVEIRNGVHDGLFTARNDEPNWGIAHRILMPAFGPASIQRMFPEMHEIARQLALKWARHGPETPIAVSDDTTRLALDTLALCSMGFRFNSYYRDELHPFVAAMADFLTESGERNHRTPFLDLFYRQAEKKYWADIDALRRTARDVLHKRKEQSGSSRKDLLTAMLEGVDAKTGQKMSDDSIIDNLITFLIAGHETTSGTLSFAFYNLLGHPDTYRKVQQEVEKVVGTGPIKFEHIGKLPYIAAVLRETLRLNAPITQFLVESKTDGVLGGKYAYRSGEQFFCFLAKSHLDPTVYGETANDFIPERMLDENFERLSKEFPDFWKPFGNGMRSCIGRPFAWQEAILFMAMAFQNFNFIPHDPKYSLQIKQTLTLKPKNFFMRAVLREGLTVAGLERRLTGDGSAAPAATAADIGSATTAAAAVQDEKAAKSDTGGANGKKSLAIFYGSNTGTCESLAQQLAVNASAHGFRASVVEPLDAANQKLPTDQPVVVITASYEGQPPDNAGLFCEWIQNLEGKELKGVVYAVFGCGHHDWAQTFQRIPKLVDTTLEAHGGTRVCKMGQTDAALGDMFTDFEQWEDEVFWPAVTTKYGVAGDEANDGKDDSLILSGLSVEICTPRASSLRQDVREAIVLDNVDITAKMPGFPPKKHMKVKLPSDMSYDVGEYIAVLPLNPKVTINRAMGRFGLSFDSHVIIRSNAPPTLPTGVSIRTYDLLEAYVELSQPATKRNILALSYAAEDPGTRKKLAALATNPDAYAAEISKPRISVLDLLEQHPALFLPFGTFLAMLPPMRVRQYSISSSPLADPTIATITYSVHDAAKLSSESPGLEAGGSAAAMTGGGRTATTANKPPPRGTPGVASTYLARLSALDRLYISIQHRASSNTAFRLPADPSTTPLICIAAGTGIAPFRGFVQERAAQIASGRKVAPMLLFFGCRRPGVDDLYRDQMDGWEKAGAVSVRRAFSRPAAGSELTSAETKCRYVDERIWEDRKELVALWEQDAKIYVCGSMGVGKAAREVIVKIAVERAKELQPGREEEELREEAEKWFERIRKERYATDVFD